MKCEICHTAEAATVLHTTRNGEPVELYVCKTCAKKAEKPKQGEPAPDVSLSIMGMDGNEPLQPIQDLLKATLGIIGKGVAEQLRKDQETCPTCKRSWQEIRDSGRLGCPNCWRAFARNIRQHFLAAQYGRRHMGEPPPNAADTQERARLERELTIAITREDYEKAATIRHALDALPSNEPRKENPES